MFHFVVVDITTSLCVASAGLAGGNPTMNIPKPRRVEIIPVVPITAHSYCGVVYYFRSPNLSD